MANSTFWDKVANKYAASPVKDVPAYEDTLDRTRHYLKPSDRLLEIGCGTGTTALTLSASVQEVIATDISGQMLSIADSKREERGITNVSFVQSEVTKPLAAAPFDAICAFSILHLVDDLQETLTHMHSQIKPGGYVISKTPCLAGMNALVRPLIKVMQFFGKAPTVLFLNARELEAGFQRAGFEVVETGHFGKNLKSHFVVARRPT
jgi:ubiquinone/menaquinone biosynthesis C-methylase UbiE